MSTAPLFLVDALPTGDTAVLDGPEGRHAATVKRLREGEGLLLADGRGGLAHAVVTSAAKDALQLEVVDRRTVAAPAPRVLLAQALVKGNRGELAVELATEAGVDAVALDQGLGEQHARGRRCHGAPIDDLQLQRVLPDGGDDGVREAAAPVGEQQPLPLPQPLDGGGMPTLGAVEAVSYTHLTLPTKA